METYMFKALNYVKENNLYNDVNILANKLNNTRLSIICIYEDIEVTEDIIKIAKCLNDLEIKATESYLTNLIRVMKEGN